MAAVSAPRKGLWGLGAGLRASGSKAQVGRVRKGQRGARENAGPERQTRCRSYTALRESSAICSLADGFEGILSPAGNHPGQNPNSIQRGGSKQEQGWPGPEACEGSHEMWWGQRGAPSCVVVEVNTAEATICADIRAIGKAPNRFSE